MRSVAPLVLDIEVTSSGMDAKDAPTKMLNRMKEVNSVEVISPRDSMPAPNHATTAMVPNITKIMKLMKEALGKRAF